MLISVRARRRVGGLNISGVDVIVYSWIRVISGTSLRRMSVDNIHAYFVYPCGAWNFKGESMGWPQSTSGKTTERLRYDHEEIPTR